MVGRWPQVQQVGIKAQVEQVPVQLEVQEVTVVHCSEEYRISVEILDMVVQRVAQDILEEAEEVISAQPASPDTLLVVGGAPVSTTIQW